MDISIIIVNYNTEKLILECLKSIYERTFNVDFEIIVVDNASSDDSLEIISNVYPQVRLVKNNENIGFGRANNEGVKIAEGDYLFFLNPDTVLLNNAVKILLDFMKSDPAVGICGGNLFDENMNFIHSYSLLFPSIFWELDQFFNGFMRRIKYGKLAYINQTDNVLNVAYITGADLLIKKDLFIVLGGFSSDFFMYYEETELAYRVRKNYYNIVNVPQAKIIHLEGQSFNLSEKRLFHMLKGRKIYYNKIYNSFYIKIVDLIFALTCMSRIFIFYFFRKSKSKYWSSIYQIFRSVK